MFRRFDFARLTLFWILFSLSRKIFVLIFYVFICFVFMKTACLEDRGGFTGFMDIGAAGAVRHKGLNRV